MAAGVMALVLGVALAAYPAAATRGLDRLVAIGALAGVLLLLTAVAGAASALPWAIAAIGAEYAAWFALRGGEGVDTRAPVYGAGLLVVAELAYWARDRRSPAIPQGGLEFRRLFGVLGAAVAALAVGAFALGISSASLGSGVGLEALGVAAAIALLVLLAVLVREDRDEPEF
jgi:hypothetical protein